MALLAAMPAAHAQAQAGLRTIPMPRPIPVTLPRPEAPADPAGRGVVRLAAAGPYLLVVRQGGGYPYSYLVLDTTATTPARRVVWQARDACCGGPPPWDVLLSPAGTGVVVLYPHGQPETLYRLVRPQGEPLPLRVFAGGAWAADGSWFGGARASYSAAGELLRPGVPSPAAVPDALFSQGPGPSQLRYVDLKRGVSLIWDGTGEPRLDRPWRCAGLAASRNFDGPSVAPVRLSGDGRYVAWSTRGGRPAVCDAQTGREIALPEETSAFAFGADNQLLYAYEGKLWRLLLPRGERQLLDLPASVVALSVAATPDAIYVGTTGGAVFRMAQP